MADDRAPSAMDRRIGERIRARRLDLGWTQDDLGQRVGLTFQQVQKYEKGSNRVTASRLAEIARAMDWDIRHFFDTPAPSVSNEQSSPAYDALVGWEGAALLTEFAAITHPEVRSRILDLVRAMARYGATLSDQSCA